jgi:lipoprotein-anchoring transpeptidase ErfK/SrfK
MRRLGLATMLVVAGCAANTTAQHPDGASAPKAPTASAVSTQAAAAVSPAVATPRRCTPGLRRISNPDTATVLYVTQPTVARAAPNLRSGVVKALSTRNAYGLRTVLLALASRVDAHCVPVWYLAKLPAKPDGVTGWVAARAATAVRITTRLDADLSRRRLTLFVNGRRVLQTPMAIGAASTPTPTGMFYVESLFRLSDPSGPYGPAALAIAAYSNAPQGWAAGNPIAIHGTAAPWTIGTAASHGCLRIANADALRLLGLVDAGTPVSIHT